MIFNNQFYKKVSGQLDDHKDGQRLNGHINHKKLNTGN